jgi:hypothetical protein
MADEDWRQARRESDEELPETEPFLRAETPRDNGSTPSVNLAATIKLPKPYKAGNVILLLYTIILVFSSSYGFSNIPLTRIVEDILCHKYYQDVGIPDGSIDEQLCKERSIQSKLAGIFAITAMLEAIVGFLAAFPWGLTADKSVATPSGSSPVMHGDLYLR